MVFPRPRAIETIGRKVGAKLKPRADKAFAEPDRAWHLVDGYGQVLGRLASKLVPLLCGKHKPIYQPQRDVGDYVVVVNVAQTVHTGKALDQKKYYRHSGYMGGLKTTTLRELIAKNPLEPLRRAVLGMLPKNRLRGQRMRRLRLFPGPEHIHEGQFQPDALAYRTSFSREVDTAAELERIGKQETA